MRALLLALIRFYKRFISPHKGYACSYRVYTGRASCSTLGYRAIRRHGAWTGLGLLQQRCRLCGVAQRRYAPVYRPPAAQRGDCDLDPGFDGDCCEGPDCDWRSRRLSCCCDLLECCEPPERKRQERKRKDKNTHLPPRNPRQDWPEDAKR
jgi:uncharacterized protein